MIDYLTCMSLISDLSPPQAEPGPSGEEEPPKENSSRK